MSITYNYKKGSEKKFPDDVISARFRIYKDKAASGKEEVWTRTEKRPPEIVARTKLEKYFRDREDAFEKECKAGLVSVKPSASPTFVDYAARVIKRKREGNYLKESTYVRYLAMLQRIKEYFGKTKLTDVTTTMLNNFYASLAEPGTNMRGSEVKGLSAKTIREHHNLISGVFKEALAEEDTLVKRNPAATARPPKAEKPEVVYYQPEELKKIAQVMETQPLKWQTFFQLAITTGCRRGEILGLKLENINLESGECHITSTLLVDKGVGVYESTPKTENSDRYFVLAPQVIDMIKGLIAENEAQKEKVGEYWTDNTYIFRQADGKPMHPDSVTDYFKKLSKEQQKTDPDFPKIKPHAFRHTTASLLIAQKYDTVTVAAYLGHASPVITNAFYAHIIKKNMSEAQKGIGDYMQSLVADDTHEEEK